jgi:hypothetical protein
MMKKLLSNYWSVIIAIAGLGLMAGMFSALDASAEKIPQVWLQPILFCLFALLAGWLMRLDQAGQTLWKLSWTALVTLAVGVTFSIIYARSTLTLTAWIFTIFIFGFFLVLDQVIISTVPHLHFVSRWLLHVLLACICGAIVCIIGQFESHFADEEFFVALQTLILGVYWLAIRGVHSSFAASLHKNTNHRDHLRLNERYYPLNLDSRWLLAACLLFAIAFSTTAFHYYQADFYPTQAPTYPGVSADSPFLCGEIQPDSISYSGRETFDRLVEQIAANPLKASPEYGMLALATTDSRWLKLFHDTLLDESRQALFTGPAGSIKSIQYEAALRVYYYSRLRTAFPGLFTLSEEQSIHSWFALINRRTFTVEPVDLLYAVAFSKWPQGPYENQEIGAGLLALLEKASLSDPILSSRNLAYLSANPRGWVERFRVTDDAAVYQPEWLNNAFFQSLFTGNSSSANMRLSFEWLLLQSLPDGAPLQYNHVYGVSLDGIGYFGTELTGDSRYLWAAGRSLDYDESHLTYTFAQPGIEEAVSYNGISPTQGSCLLFGDSGLPNQIGPLSPDKIVIRDGWQADSTYLLLNLRFTGWHRYKATNTITMLYKNGPLLVENTSHSSYSWLPAGRALFRDKRIPRENLNGLVVSRTGLSAVLYRLTGIGGPWAQDPPYYASVLNFDPSTSTSVTEISGWRGWTQRRTISLENDSLTIMDDVSGVGQAAIIWHFPIGAVFSGDKVTIRSGDLPVEAFINVDHVNKIVEVEEESGLRLEIHGRGSFKASLTFHFGELASKK